MKILIGKIENLSSADVLRGIELGRVSSGIEITSVQGTESAPIRNNYSNWSGKDGGYMSSQLYGGREITIEGFYVDDKGTCFSGAPGEEGYLSKREELINKLRIRNLHPLFFQLLSGKIFYTEGYLIDIKMEFANYKTGDYSLTFYCPDYAFSIASKYGDINSIWHEQILTTSGGAGHLVPNTLPVLFESSLKSSIVNYAGVLHSYPIITLTGPMKAPITVYNSTYNRWLTITQDLEEGSVIKIDMSKREVLKNGRSISFYLSSDSSWWYLEPGENVIYISSAGDNDNPNSLIEWADKMSGF